MSESRFQSNLIKELEFRYDGCIVLKNDANHIQGIPDLLVLYKSKWAALEVKKSEKERRDPEPNQEWYVQYLNRMGFSSFIFPENKEDVLNRLDSYFLDRRLAK